MVPGAAIPLLELDDEEADDEVDELDEEDVDVELSPSSPQALRKAQPTKSMPSFVQDARRGLE